MPSRVADFAFQRGAFCLKNVCHAEFISASLVQEIPKQVRNDGECEIPKQVRNDGEMRSF